MAKQRVGPDVFWEQFFPERDSPEIFKGENAGICSFDDFLVHMSGPGNRNGLTFLRGYDEAFKVFWYETKEGKSTDTRFVFGPSIIIRDRVKSALMSARLCSSSAVMFQFWAPMKTNIGEIKLTLSEQPFGLGNLYNGLCRYKYHCIKRNCEDHHGQNGPPARVFKRGLRENCWNMMHYSTDEFPTRDYAIECGIISYFAVPLFESGENLHCVGVLECFSMDNYDFNQHEYPVECAAKELGLELQSPHFHECDKIRRDILCPRAEVKKALKNVREAHQLPLVQLWVPCMCDPNQKSLFKNDNKLFCDMRVCGENLKCLSEFKNFRSKYGTFFVRGKEGLVGSAYIENSPCFFSDAGQLSLSDSPFAHLTRSAGLTACFVIPLKFVYPILDLYLEMFLPPESTCTNGDSEAMLKPLLSTVAQEFSKLNSTAVVGLKQNEIFSARFSFLGHEKFDFSFFYVYRTTKVNTCSTDPHAHGTNDSLGEVIATVAEDKITLDVLKPYFGNIIDAAAQNLGVSRSTLKRRCRVLGIKRWPWHKRNKVKHIQSNSRLQITQTLNNATEKEAPHSQIQTNNSAADREAADATDSVPSSTNADIIHQSYDMIGKATHGDDTVMFPLNIDSGIKDLHKELNQRFQLQAGQFKIKYKYEDEWISIICDQDLRLGLEMIKSTGEKTINLSISPLSTS